MRNEYQMDTNTVEKYLNVIVQDTASFFLCRSQLLKQYFLLNNSLTVLKKLEIMVVMHMQLVGKAF